MNDINDNSTYSPRGGMILISSPLLEDPNFKRSVILLLDKGTKGDFIGLILNRRLDITLNEICEMPGEANEANVFNGGPVDLQRMFWLHTYGDRLEGSHEVMPGLFVGGDYNNIIRAYQQGKHINDNIRFYIGYSGWSADQLENEIRHGAWAVLPAVLDPETLIRTEGDEMWHTLVKRLGPDYRHWLMIPSDPNMN